jgi:hypothetical protein
LFFLFLANFYINFETGKLPVHETIHLEVALRSSMQWGTSHHIASCKWPDKVKKWNKSRLLLQLPLYHSAYSYFVINEEKSQISYITMYGRSHHQNDTQSLCKSLLLFLFLFFFIVCRII